MAQFDRDTAITLLPDGRYDTEIRDNWNVMIGPNGGYIAAIILRALMQQLDDPARTPRSVTYHFLTPSVPGPARVEVSLEKLGRSFATLTGRLQQGGRTIAIALATFAPPREFISFRDFTMPRVPAPQEIPESSRMGPAMAGHVPFRDHYDQRIAIGPVPPGKGARARVGGWTRFVDPRPFDALAVVAISDSWYPSIFVREGPSVSAPTIDHTVHFFASLPLPQLPADAFLLVEFTTVLSQEGFLQEEGRIWAPDGTLIAQSRQLALAALAAPEA